MSFSRVASGRRAGPFRRRIAVWLKPNGTYRLFEYGELMDYRIMKLAVRFLFLDTTTDPEKRASLQAVISQWMESKG